LLPFRVLQACGAGVLLFGCHGISGRGLVGW
jgi:hypothetical protein